MSDKYKTKEKQDKKNISTLIFYQEKEIKNKIISTQISPNFKKYVLLRKEWIDKNQNFNFGIQSLF